jgi:predicted DNA-binding transcriptional regulator AlpA
MQATDEQPQYFLGVTEAARTLGVSRSTLYAMFRARVLHPCHIGCRAVVAVQELRSYSRSIAAASGVPAGTCDPNPVGEDREPVEAEA